MGNVFTGLVASCLVDGGFAGLTLTQRVLGSRERSRQEEGLDGLSGLLATRLDLAWPLMRVGWCALQVLRFWASRSSCS